MPPVEPGPRRRASDSHFHPEYWTEEDHHRFEDRVARQIEGLSHEVKGLGNRVTMMLGALAIIGFLLPIVAPFIRALIPGQ